MNDAKLDPAKTYVLEETVRTKSLTLEQLADIATRKDDAPDLDFESALKDHNQISRDSK